MEKKGPSQNIFSEIFDKPESAPPFQRPRYEYPPQDESSGPPPVEDNSSLAPPTPAPPTPTSQSSTSQTPTSQSGGPTQKSGPPGSGVRLLPYVCMAIGAALLAMAVCLFLMVGMNGRLDALEEAVAGLDSVDQQLAEKNDYLTRQNELLSGRVSQVNEEKTRLEQELVEAHHSWSTLVTRSKLENMLDALEEFTGAGDWLMAGSLIQYYDFYFNEHNNQSMPGNLLPSQATWYLELREEVFGKAGCMVMESYTTTEDWNEYTEQPYIGGNIFADEDLEAARALLAVLEYYPIAPDNAAWHLAEFFQPDSEHRKRLNGGAFQPSTVELFEQIWADLLANGFLVENGDGTVSSLSEHPEYRVVYGK